jgi:hypothetical protein
VDRIRAILRRELMIRMIENHLAALLDAEHEAFAALGRTYATLAPTRN